MLLARLLRRLNQALKHRRGRPRARTTHRWFRPEIDVLEERTVPSIVYDSASGMIWMSNAVYQAGFNTSWGGTLTNLNSGGYDIVNRYDDGREVQATFYDGNQSYSTGWNPVEGGDKYNHGSAVL